MTAIPRFETRFGRFFRLRYRLVRLIGGIVFVCCAFAAVDPVVYQKADPTPEDALLTLMGVAIKDATQLEVRLIKIRNVEKWCAPTADPPFWTAKQLGTVLLVLKEDNSELCILQYPPLSAGATELVAKDVQYSRNIRIDRTELATVAKGGTPDIARYFKQLPRFLVSKDGSPLLNENMLQRITNENTAYKELFLGSRDAFRLKAALCGFMCLVVLFIWRIIPDVTYIRLERHMQKRYPNWQRRFEMSEFFQTPNLRELYRSETNREIRRVNEQARKLNKIRSDADHHRAQQAKQSHNRTAPLSPLESMPPPLPGSGKWAKAQRVWSDLIDGQEVCQEAATLRDKAFAKDCTDLRDKANYLCRAVDAQKRYIASSEQQEQTMLTSDFGIQATG